MCVFSRLSLWYSIMEGVKKQSNTICWYTIKTKNDTRIAVGKLLLTNDRTDIVL